MSPRPRTRSDEEIFSATHRTISAVGPARLTLSRVAEAADLSAAALVQRFGSKRDLLIAFVEHGVESMPEELRDQRRRYDSPLESLVELLSATEGFASTPEELANHTAFLHMDLTDPDFHGPAVRHFRCLLEETRKRLEEASEAGELEPPEDAGDLARTLLAVRNGALLNWAIEGRGDAGDYVRSRLQRVLRS